MTDKGTKKEKVDAPVEKEKKTARKVVEKRKPKEEKGEKHRDIGLDVQPPAGKCDDKYCPFHGKLPVRGIVIDGIVSSDKMMKSVVVKRKYLKYNEKFERYEKRTRKYMAHNPPCINAKIGDEVKLAECRPLSKTISFVVIERR
ncbi:MAG: 30S ribosomal protein S17 [Thermoplasmata archaeon]